LIFHLDEHLPHSTKILILDRSSDEIGLRRYGATLMNKTQTGANAQQANNEVAPDRLHEIPLQSREKTPRHASRQSDDNRARMARTEMT
jgi:hypothetical protein